MSKRQGAPLTAAAPQKRRCISVSLEDRHRGQSQQRQTIVLHTDTQTQRSPPSLPQRREGRRLRWSVELTLHEDFVGSLCAQARLESGTAENADDVMDLDQEDQNEEEREKEEGNKEKGKGKERDYMITEEERDNEEAHNESSPVPSLSPPAPITFHVVREPKKSSTTTTTTARITTCRVTRQQQLQQLQQQQQQQTANIGPPQEFSREHSASASASSSSSRPHPTTQAQARAREVQPECTWYVGSEWAAAAGGEGTQQARQGQADIRIRLDDRDDADGARRLVSTITTAARGDHLDVADADGDEHDDATQPGQDNAHRPSGVSGAAATAATATTAATAAAAAATATVTAIAQTPGVIPTARAGVPAGVIWWAFKQLIRASGMIADDEGWLAQTAYIVCIGLGIHLTTT
ncbi:hypothetical protein F5X98DRAFT_359660 [Xylaria grammica]|nr:hypothetical protein F5X98DRAFT_359660 [Xylaria grammica]